VRFLGSVSGLCGRSVVMSSFTIDVWNRRVGVYGLYVLIAIFSSQPSAVSHQLVLLKVELRCYGSVADLKIPDSSVPPPS
jgi:hypothetical protein